MLKYLKFLHTRLQENRNNAIPESYWKCDLIYSTHFLHEVSTRAEKLEIKLINYYPSSNTHTKQENCGAFLIKNKAQLW